MIHKPPKKFLFVTQCYAIREWPNELEFICWTGDFNHKLMIRIFENEYRLKRLIDYLPQTIVNRLRLDYLPYDLLLNDWRKELLEWFSVRKFDISDKLVDIFAKHSMGTNGYIA